MPKVIAIPHSGKDYPMMQFKQEREILDTLSSSNTTDAIGKCVADAVRLAWHAGVDPAQAPFMVIVTFE